MKINSNVSNGGLLPPTTDGSSYAQLAAATAFPPNWPCSDETRQNSPNHLFSQFFVNNPRANDRKEFLSECRKFLHQLGLNIGDIVPIAKTAVLSKLDFDTFADFLEWYFDPRGNAKDDSLCHVFCQMMDQSEICGTEVPSFNDFVNSRLKVRPSLYWASDSLHRMFVDVLNRFCKPDVDLDDLMALIPRLQRVIRRIVAAKDLRYRMLIRKVYRVASGRRSEKNSPELYEFMGLVEWADVQLETSTSLHNLSLQMFGASDIGKLHINLGIEFSCCKNLCDGGLYNYTYLVKVNLDVPGLDMETELGQKWKDLRCGLRMTTETDCPIDWNYHLFKVQTSFQNHTLSKIEFNYKFVTTSAHCRLFLSLHDRCDKEMFKGLSVYLPQDDILPLRYSCDNVIEVKP